MARVLAFAAMLLLLVPAARADLTDPALPGKLDLERGHQKKVAGAALIGVGSALALMGQILLIHEAVAPTKVLALCPTDYPSCGLIYDHDEQTAGAVTLGVGAALLLAGIPLYTVGGAQMRRARPTLTFLPRVDRDGARLTARLRF